MSASLTEDVIINIGDEISDVKAPCADLSTSQDRQHLLNTLMTEIDSDEGPTYFSYPVFLLYLMRGAHGVVAGEFVDTLQKLAEKILATANGDAYIVDGSVYVRDCLKKEFPEFTVFEITLEESFVESPIHPGIWIETRHFADLRTLSRMRHALKTTRTVDGMKMASIVKVLLGL